jgi:hypothetical protein
MDEDEGIAQTGGAVLHSNLQRNNPLLHQQLRMALHSVQPYRHRSILLPVLPHLNHADQTLDQKP